MSFAYHPHDIQKFSWVHDDASASSRRFLENKVVIFEICIVSQFHHCDGRKNMVSFPSGFETETKARRHITMLFVGSLEARTKFWRKIRPFEHVVPIERGQG